MRDDLWSEGTGVFVVLEEEPSVWSAVPVEVPTGFRFGEINPVSGVPYIESRFGELPEYAARVVLDELGMAAPVWNVDVRCGDVDDFVDPDEWFPTTRGSAVMTGAEIRVYVRRLTDLRDEAQAEAARYPAWADYSRGAASAYALALHALHVFSGGVVEVPADVLGDGDR